MKLRNKKTGYIATADRVWVDDTNEQIVVDVDGELYRYYTLEALRDEWEDYEEPKGYWYIDYAAPYPIDFCEFNEDTEDDKEIGNYFETKEEAEKAVEKLKAWRRLKQGGFHWNSWTLGGAHFGLDLYDGYNNDLDLVFGGEE
jgi:hypothetical protein